MILLQGRESLMKNRARIQFSVRKITANVSLYTTGNLGKRLPVTILRRMHRPLSGSRLIPMSVMRMVNNALTAPIQIKFNQSRALGRVTKRMSTRPQFNTPDNRTGHN